MLSDKYLQSGKVGDVGISNIILDRYSALYPDFVGIDKNVNTVADSVIIPNEYDDELYRIYVKQNESQTPYGIVDIVMDSKCPDGYVDLRSERSKYDNQHLKLNRHLCAKIDIGPHVKKLEFVKSNANTFGLIQYDENNQVTGQPIVGTDLHIKISKPTSLAEYCNMGYNSLLPQCREYCLIHGNCDDSVKLACNSELMTKEDNEKFGRFCSCVNPTLDNKNTFYDITIDGDIVTACPKKCDGYQPIKDCQQFRKIDILLDLPIVETIDPTLLHELRIACGYNFPRSEQSNNQQSENKQKDYTIFWIVLIVIVMLLTTIITFFVVRYFKNRSNFG